MTRKDDMDQLQLDKYTGTNEFNPKSFKLGPSHGYIDFKKAAFELLYTQVKLQAKIMFTNILMSRFCHLIGNGGLNVWSKQTALTAMPWKANMHCLMAGKHMPGCNCPIKAWFNKKMFVAHWLIYYIDQHISRLICDFKKDDVRCQYTTDCEVDMKHHVLNVHEARHKELIASMCTFKRMLGWT